jgi:hypothetical protein
VYSHPPFIGPGYAKSILAMSDGVEVFSYPEIRRNFPKPHLKSQPAVKKNKVLNVMMAMSQIFAEVIVQVGIKLVRNASNQWPASRSIVVGAK